MSLHLQACTSLRDYGRLWCCGFPYLGLLGSAAFEATVVDFVIFCFLLRLGCPPPPSPASSGLRWLPVSRLGFTHPGLISVCGLLFFGGSLFGHPSPSLPRPSELNPVGVSPFFSLFLCFAFLFHGSARIPPHRQSGCFAASWF